MSLITATEWCPWRGRLVKGSVHDENAEVLGGVAGHAGLFSTAGDLARLGQVMLGGGQLAGRRVLAADLVAALTTPRTDHLPLRRCLGWQGPDPVGCPVGSRPSRNSYGHTGFTGTSLWIDPERGLFAVLLTNAVHPKRRPDGLRSVRCRFHDAVFAA
jgi:CubicO group peptidase (beta-lactamase class C family)